MTGETVPAVPLWQRFYLGGQSWSHKIIKSRLVAQLQMECC